QIYYNKEHGADETKRFNYYSGDPEEAYDDIRAKKVDVQSISRNTGLKEENIQIVKDHIFYNEHLKDRYVDKGIPAVYGRLDADIDYANAWKRLEQGNFIESDIELLKHEFAEAKYMQKYGPSYNNAHNAVQKKYPAPNYDEISIVKT